MNQQQINYVFGGAIVLLAVILGFFGFTLPVTPVIPDPLPAPDLTELTSRLDALEAQALLGGGEATSFGVSVVPCVMERGGNQWTAGNGCTWAVESGGTLDLQPGSTISITGFVTSTLYGLTVRGNELVTGTLTVSGTTTAAGGVTGNLTGNVTGALSTTAPITVSGMAFTYTAPLTITGVLTDVRLLFYQVP